MMMTSIYEAALRAYDLALTGSLVTGAWDLLSFLQNAKSYVQEIGGGALMLCGTGGLVWGGIKGIQKLMSPANHGQQTHWGTIIALVLVGGAIATGGWTLISKVGSGGQTTITQLGGGAIVRHSAASKTLGH